MASCCRSQGGAGNEDDVETRRTLETFGCNDRKETADLLISSLWLKITNRYLRARARLCGTFFCECDDLHEDSIAKRGDLLAGHSQFLRSLMHSVLVEDTQHLFLCQRSGCCVRI